MKNVSNFLINTPLVSGTAIFNRSVTPVSLKAATYRKILITLYKIIEVKIDHQVENKLKNNSSIL